MDKRIKIRELLEFVSLDSAYYMVNAYISRIFFRVRMEWAVLVTALG